MGARSAILEERRTRLSAAKRALLDKQVRGRAQREASDPIPQRPPGPAPLSFAQERLWFLQQLDPSSAAFHVRIAQRIHGPLDTGIFDDCLSALVRRHEVLRTTFPSQDGIPSQIVSPATTCRATLVDLRALGDIEQEQAVATAIDGDTARPFDLERGPLLRVSLLRLRDDEHVFLFITHHIVMDGLSLGTFCRELGELYGARLAGTRPHLPALPIQYADFAAWQRSHLTHERLESDLAFWKTQLADAPQVL
jgi:hypothetical protein